MLTEVLSALPAPLDRFGRRVAPNRGTDGAIRLFVSGGAAAGDDLFVGSVHAFFFRRGRGGWEPEERLVAEDSSRRLDHGASASGDQDRVGIGAFHPPGEPGSVYLAVRGLGGWSRETVLSAPAPASDDRFGTSIALRGHWLPVGAPGAETGGPGAAHRYERRATGGWTRRQTLALNPPDHMRFGLSVALDAGFSVVGAPGRPGMTGDAAGFSGRGALFAVAPRADPPRQPAQASGAAVQNYGYVGASPAMAGCRLMVGAPGVFGLNLPGEVYLFDVSADGLAEAARMQSDDLAEFAEFASAVAISGVRAAVGALTEDATERDAGAGFVMSMAAGASPLLHAVRPDDRQWNGQIGYAAAIFDHVAALGAPGDHSAGVGAGSVYLLE